MRMLMEREMVKRVLAEKRDDVRATSCSLEGQTEFCQGK